MYNKTQKQKINDLGQVEVMNINGTISVVVHSILESPNDIKERQTVSL